MSWSERVWKDLIFHKIWMWCKIIASYNLRIHMPGVCAKLSRLRLGWNIKNSQAYKPLTKTSAALAAIIENAILSDKAN